MQQWMLPSVVQQYARINWVSTKRDPFNIGQCIKRFQRLSSYARMPMEEKLSASMTMMIVNDRSCCFVICVLTLPFQFEAGGIRWIHLCIEYKNHLNHYNMIIVIVATASAFDRQLFLLLSKILIESFFNGYPFHSHADIFIQSQTCMDT